MSTETKGIRLYHNKEENTLTIVIQNIDKNDIVTSLIASIVERAVGVAPEVKEVEGLLPVIEEIPPVQTSFMKSENQVAEKSADADAHVELETSAGNTKQLEEKSVETATGIEHGNDAPISLCSENPDSLRNIPDNPTENMAENISEDFAVDLDDTVINKYIVSFKNPNGKFIGGMDFGEAKTAFKEAVKEITGKYPFFDKDGIKQWVVSTTEKKIALIKAKGYIVE